MANVIVGKVAVRPRGAYNKTVEYEKLDIVRYNGNAYTVLKKCVGVTPSDDGQYYSLTVERGAQGPQGERGLPGTGLRIIDYYDTLTELKNNVKNPEVGDTYGVGTSEPYTIYVYSKTDGWINNGMIEGPQGPQGIQGPTGDSGVYIGDTEPTDPDINVWIAPSGDSSTLITQYQMEDYVDSILQEMANNLTT